MHLLLALQRVPGYGGDGTARGADGGQKPSAVGPREAVYDDSLTPRPEPPPAAASSTGRPSSLVDVRPHGDGRGEAPASPASSGGALVARRGEDRHAPLARRVGEGLRHAAVIRLVERSP